MGERQVQGLTVRERGRHRAEEVGGHAAHGGRAGGGHDVGLEHVHRDRERRGDQRRRNLRATRIRLLMYLQSRHTGRDCCIKAGGHPGDDTVKEVGVACGLLGRKHIPY